MLKSSKQLFYKQNTLRNILSYQFSEVQIEDKLKNNNPHSQFSSPATIDWGQFNSITQIRKAIQDQQVTFDFSMPFLKSDIINLYERVNYLKENSIEQSVNKEMQSIKYFMEQLQENSDTIFFTKDLQDSQVKTQQYLEQIVDIDLYMQQNLGNSKYQTVLSTPAIMRLCLMNNFMAQRVLDSLMKRYDYSEILEVIQGFSFNNVSQIYGICNGLYQKDKKYRQFKQKLGRIICDPKNLHKYVQNMKQFYLYVKELALQKELLGNLQMCMNFLVNFITKNDNFPLQVQEIQQIIECIVKEHRQVYRGKQTIYFHKQQNQDMQNLFLNRILGEFSKSEDHISGYFKVVNILQSNIKNAQIIEGKFLKQLVEKLDQYQEYLNGESCFYLYALLQSNPTQQDLVFEKLGLIQRIQSIKTQDWGNLLRENFQNKDNMLKKLLKRVQESNDIDKIYELYLLNELKVYDQQLMAGKNMLQEYKNDQFVISYYMRFNKVLSFESKQLLQEQIIGLLKNNIGRQEFQDLFNQLVDIDREFLVQAVNKSQENKQNIYEKLKEIFINSQTPYEFELILYYFRQLNTTFDDSLLKFMQNYIENNALLLTTKHISSIYYLVSVMNRENQGPLYENLIKSLQELIQPKVHKFQPEEINLINKTLAIHYQNTKFYQCITETIRNNSAVPAYQNTVCDYVYSQMKRMKRLVFLKPMKENMIKSLSIDDSYVKIFNLVGFISSIGKFNDTEEFKPLLNKKIMKSKPGDIKPQELPFVYSHVIQNAQIDKKTKKVSYQTKDVLNLLEKQIIKKLEVNQITSFDIGRIIHSLAISYSSIQRDQFLEKLMQKSCNPKFYIKHNKQKDIGLFCMMFWSHSLLSGNKAELLKQFLDQNQDYLEEIVKKIQDTEVAFKDKKTFNKDTKRELLDIHLNQIQEGLYTIQSLGIQTRLGDLQKYIDKIEQNKYYGERKTIKMNKNKVLSYFQQQTEFLIKQRFETPEMAEKTKGYILEQEYTGESPYCVDFYLAYELDGKQNKIIIECNGKQHYKNGQLKFNHAVKTQILQLKGYKVIDINIDEWNGLKKHEQAKYIENKIFENNSE